MKKFSILLLLVLAGILTNPLAAQEISYGSNNGRYVEIYGNKIYYEEYGEGIPLLLLHGGLIGSIAHYKQVIPEYAKEFRVIAIDSPGHGRSELPDSLSYQLLADYFSQFIDVLELDSVYIIGWSDGGIAAMLLASDRPDKVKRIVTLGSNIDRSGNIDYRKLSYNEVAEWTDFIEEYKAKAFAGNDFKSFVEEVAAMWDEEPYVPMEKVNRIKCRTLVALGDRDDFYTIDHIVKIYRSIKGSELFIIPNADHFAFWTHSELLVDVSTDFLNRD